MGRNFFESCAHWLVILILLSTSAIAGPLNPPAAPAPTFKTLDEAAPGTPIRQSDLPLTISEPGHYYLVENLKWSGTGAAITLVPSGVTLDLGGFLIDGVAATASSSRKGIDSQLDGNVIRNGSVTNMGGGGIDALRATIEDVLVSNSHIYGIINVGGVTRRCVVRGIARPVDSAAVVAGIQCGFDGVVEDCVVMHVSASAGTGSIYGVVGLGGSAIRRVKVYGVSSASPNDNPVRVYGIILEGAGFIEQCHVESIRGEEYALETVGIRSGRLSRIQGNHVHDVSARLTCVGIQALSQASVTGNHIGTIGFLNSNDSVIGIDLDDRASATGNTIEMWRPNTSFTTAVSGIRTNGLASVDQNVIRLDMSITFLVNAAGVRVESGAARVADNRVHVQMNPTDPSSVGRGIFMMAGSAGGYAGGNISRGAIVNNGTNTIGSGNFANQVY